MERCLCGIFIVTCVGAALVTSPGSGSPCDSPCKDAVISQVRLLGPHVVPKAVCPHHTLREQTWHCIGAAGTRG